MEQNKALLEMNKEEIKSVKAEINTLLENAVAFGHANYAIYRQYCDMEGMYGTKISDRSELRGYYYKYATVEIKKKENAEREQFLKDNNYLKAAEFKKYTEEHFYRRVRELQDRLSILAYGYTLKEVEQIEKIERYEEEIAKLQKKIAKVKAEMNK